MTNRVARYALWALAGVCAILGLIPVANLISAGSVPWWGAAVREWALFGGMVVLLALAVSATLPRQVDALRDGVVAALGRPSARAFAVGSFLVAAGAAAAVALWSFSGLPFTSDEMATAWHAQVLRSGRLFAIAEPFPEFFNTAPVFDRDGRWFSQYPVGGPALTALGGIAGAAWLVNPLLIGVTAVASYRFFRAAFDELTARATILLFVSSPMVFIMAGSQMNHVPALALTMLGLACLASWHSAADSRAAARSGAALGLCVGAIALFRPLDALLVGVVVGGFQLLTRRHDVTRWLPAEVVAGLLPIALLLLVNAKTTGAPLLFGYEALNGPAHGIGFHVDPNGQMHTPLRGVAIVSGYLMRLSRYLFEWPLPAMAFVVAGLVLDRATRWAALLGALVAAFLVGYAAYWFDGFFAGPRFLFGALPAFVFFAMRGIQRLTETARWPLLRRALVLLAPLCVAWSWAGPSFGSSARARVASYREQRTKLKTDIGAQVGRAGLTHALVLVNDGWRGRLLSRLRVAGFSQFAADRMLATLDACALQTGLDAHSGAWTSADRDALVARARAYGPARPEQNLPADQVVALVPGTRPTPACLREFLADTAGVMPYPIFLARQTVGDDGRIGGPVVFARDMGALNERLRERFGDRTWYRYRTPRALDDTTNVFLPYSAP